MKVIRELIIKLISILGITSHDDGNFLYGIKINLQMIEIPE
jgi:hypothetical protein